MEEKKNAAPQRKRKRGNRKGTILKVIGTLFAIVLLTVVMFFGIFMKYVHTTLEPVLYVDASAYTLNLSSVIYYQDDDGEWRELQKVHGVENRTLIEYSDIPEHVWQALVAIEDQRFFEHNGVDWKSTARAVFNMVTGSGSQRGGSTLTQQVIKNLTGENEATIKRKVTEIFRALRFAENYSREEVITLYLNLVYFGDGCYGIAAAADNYFGKEVGELSVAEAACIVGITQYPYQYDPSRGDWFREQNKKRQLDVLYKMYEQKFIDEAVYESAKEEPLVFVWDEGYVAREEEQDTEQVVSEYNSYIVEQVFKDVVAGLMEEKGYSKSIAEDLIYTGGYQIYSTIDPELQRIVESVYGSTENLPYTSAKGEQLQSGMTVIDNKTGNIVAMAGRIGEKTGAFDWNYATNPRPCGSAIKPLSVYAPALEANAITAATVLDDYPVRLQMNEDDELKAWPKNSYTGYKGLITLREAIRVSTNTTAVRVLETIGPSASYAFLTDKLGFSTLVNDDLNSAALALGGFTYGVNTVEMAAAYSAFANNGVYTKPRTYVEVRDNNGNVILENKQESSVALKESTVYTMNDMLKNVVRSGTGTEAAFSGMTIAGKTGTTSNNYDRYFVGYTPYYSAAVWIGYDYNTRISASGNPAAQLWKKVMSEVHETLPNADFSTTRSGMKETTVCTKTGLLAGADCPSTQSVYVPDGSAPVLVCDGHLTMSVCTESGALATEYCPTETVQAVLSLDLGAESVANGMGYTRELLAEPPTSKALKEHEALLASDPTAAAPTDTVIYANDPYELYQDLVNKGVCTLHEAPEVVIVDPSMEGILDFLPEFGDELDDEPTEEENANFLNQLLGE